MIDLTQTPFVFQQKTLPEIRDQLAAGLPNCSEVTVKDGSQPEILIRGGFWRGATLRLEAPTSR